MLPHDNRGAVEIGHRNKVRDKGLLNGPFLEILDSPGRY